MHGNGSQLLDTADVVVSEIFQGREAHTVAVSQELRQVLWLRPVATEGRQQLLATLGEVLLQFVSEVTDLQHHLVLVLPADMVDDLAQSVGKAEGRAGAGQGRGQGQEQGQGQGQGRAGQGRAGQGQGRAGQGSREEQEGRALPHYNGLTSVLCEVYRLYPPSPSCRDARPGASVGASSAHANGQRRSWQFRV